MPFEDETMFLSIIISLPPKTSPFWASLSCSFIEPKLIFIIEVAITITIVRSAYKLYGIVRINSSSPFVPSTTPVTAAAQDEIGAMIHIGAAVASII